MQGLCATAGAAIVATAVMLAPALVCAQSTADWAQWHDTRYRWELDRDVLDFERERNAQVREKLKLKVRQSPRPAAFLTPAPDALDPEETALADTDTSPKAKGDESTKQRATRPDPTVPDTRAADPAVTTKPASSRADEAARAAEARTRREAEERRRRDEEARMKAELQANELERQERIAAARERALERKRNELSARLGREDGEEYDDDDSDGEIASEEDAEEEDAGPELDPELEAIIDGFDP